MKNQHLTGGLFPARGKPRPLARSQSALSVAQSHKEDDHLIALFDWIRDRARCYPEIGRSFHVENERLLAPVTVERKGKSVTYGAGFQKRKDKGVRKGILDVLNLTPRRGHPYLAIELKVKDEQPTPEQAAEIAWMRAEGAFVHVCWCWSEAARLILYYFEITDRLLYQTAGKPEDYLVPKWGGHNERCGCGLRI